MLLPRPDLRNVSRQRVAAAVALCVGGGFAVSCAPDPDDTRPSPLDAVVSIATLGCPSVAIGTGAFVDRGLVLTSAHVVAGARQIETTDEAGVVRSGVVVHLDPVLDIALIEVAGAPDRGLIIGPPDLARNESGVVVLPALPDAGVATRSADADAATRSAENSRSSNERSGSSDSGPSDSGPSEAVQHRVEPVILVRPVLINTEDIYIEEKVSRRGYELAAKVVAGDSGSPVLVNNQVVAIVWARSRIDDSRAWATDVSTIVQQIEHPATRSIPPGNPCT